MKAMESEKTDKETDRQILLLQKEVDFNNRIHCYRVAARIQREIDKLRKEKTKE